MEVGSPHVDGSLLSAEHGCNDGDKPVGDVVSATGVRKDIDVAPPPFRDGDTELVAHTVLARIAIGVRLLGEDRDNYPIDTLPGCRRNSAQYCVIGTIAHALNPSTRRTSLVIASFQPNGAA